MERNQIWAAIEMAVRESKKEQPNWPDHHAGQVGYVVEPVGRLMGWALSSKYKQLPKTELNRSINVLNMEKEAIQTAAMAIRFLENLK